MAATVPTPLKTLRKDPSAVLPYPVDWSDWLESGDIIQSSSWLFDPATGLVKDSDTFSDDATECVLSGGVDGISYLVTNRITTLDGLTDDRTFQVVVTQR